MCLFLLYFLVLSLPSLPRGNLHTTFTSVTQDQILYLIDTTESFQKLLLVIIDRNNH